MSTTLGITEVSRRSGFAPPTLRYYEQIGLLPAARRTEAGYRTYDESILGPLALIATAKMIGCSLQEIAELMPSWDEGRCGPVQDRLRDLAAAKRQDARHRIAELEAFSADLDRIEHTLGSRTADGPCDADCGCLRAAIPTSAPVSSNQVSLRKTAAVADGPAIACTLEPSQVPARVQEWTKLLNRVSRRAPIDAGIRLEFADEAPIADLVRLVAAEQTCCRFFEFAITVDGRGLGLEVRAPAEGQSILDALFGTA